MMALIQLAVVGGILALANAAQTPPEVPDNLKPPAG